MWSFRGARHKHQLGPICRDDEAPGLHLGTIACSLCTRPLLTPVKALSPQTSSFYTTDVSKDSDKNQANPGQTERVGLTQVCVLCCKAFQNRQLDLAERERRRPPVAQRNWLSYQALSQPQFPRSRPLEPQGLLTQPHLGCQVSCPGSNRKSSFELWRVETDLLLWFTAACLTTERRAQ